MLQRTCACGGTPGPSGECAECRRKRLLQPKLTVNEPGDKYEQEADLIADQLMRMPGRSTLPIHSEALRVPIHPQRIGFDEQDEIHAPLIQDYRQQTGQPPGGVDAMGNQVGPTDAELKYSGALSRMGFARWLPADINRRNAAEVWFGSRPFAGSAGGLTTQFINGREIHSNLDVEAAIAHPSVQTRPEGQQTACWFDRGVSATSHTRMDIFTNGPWNFDVPRAKAASRFSWEQSCQTGSGDVTIHLDGDSSDQALETFIRLGEAEHDTDTEQAFRANIARYISNVNRLAGDTPRTREVAPNAAACRARLTRLANRSLLTQFVHDLNAATARRHAGGRHSATVYGLQINRNCSRVTVDMLAGTL